MSNVARDIIWPNNLDILVRVVFLHVGQGTSIVVLAANGMTYETLLVDINLDEKNEGIDVPRLMKDLLADQGGKLGVFVNTHPHNDHLCGVLKLSEAIDIQAVWHSGHVPGEDHCETYNELQEVITKVTAAGGEEVLLLGSRSAKGLGEAQYYVLAPAEYVCDEIAGETAEERYRRIHEQCAVMKFGLEPTWIMITGDADRDAWEKHVTDYHSKRLGAVILDAAHHGSRTFFRYDIEDEPYLDALKQIAPDYVIISAPRPEESQWGHPHDDAIELYADEVGADNVLNTGDQRHSFICDIFRDGTYVLQPDNGQLVTAYALGNDENDDGGSRNRGGSTRSIISGTRIDDRPMGSL